MRCLKFVRCLCLAALLGSVALVTSGEAAEDIFAPYEAALLTKINWARSNPSQAADLVGMTSTLDGGLGVLQPNELLTQTAGAHTLEMAENHFYSYTSLDGRSAETRIFESGYNAVLLGEMLGLVTFTNYMPPETAVNILFSQLLKRDLQQIEAGGESYIFNGAVDEIGIAMTAGRVKIGAADYNGYILTCDFGSPAEDRYGIQTAEFLFMDLMNRMRIAPAETLAEFGIDVAALISDRPELAEVLNEGMTPVACVPSFRALSLSRNQEAFETLFSGTDGEVAVFREDHCALPLSDCFAVSGEIAAAYQDGGNLTMEEVVRLIFQELLLQDLAVEDFSGMFILNPDIQEIASIFGYRQINSTLGTVHRYVLSNAYGKGYLSLPEKQSLNLLNQVRTATAEVTVASDGPSFSESEVLTASDTEEESASTAEPAPPLTANHLIYAAADAHAREMIEYAYFDTYSHDGTLNLGDRLTLAGYLPLKFFEAIEMATEATAFDFEAAGAVIFEDFLVALDLPDSEPEGLFDPAMESAGIRFLYSSPVEGALEGTAEEAVNSFQNVYSLVVVADVAAPAGMVESADPVLVVLVFVDANMDGQYDRSEELKAAPVDIYSGETVYRFYTDSAGCITVPLATGTYEVAAAFGDVLQTLTVDMGAESQMATFPFQPVEELLADGDETAVSTDEVSPVGGDETLVDIN